MTAPVFWFYLYWLPPFLNQQYSLGINVTQMGIPLIIIWLTADFGSIGGGILSSWLIGRGMRATTARLLSMLIFACTMLSVIFAANASGLGRGGGHLPGGRRAPGVDGEHLEPGDGLHAQAPGEHGVRLRQHVRGNWRDVHDADRRQRADRTNNNYAVLFTMIPAMYFLALVWMYFMAPRKVESA
jgi:ACS family hexuronate transporter-like MFS transporter